MSTNNTEVDSVVLLQRLRNISDVLGDIISRARALLSSTGTHGIVPRDYIQNLHDIAVIELLPDFYEIENQLNGLPEKDSFREPIDTVYNSFNDLAELIESMFVESRQFSEAELQAHRQAVERLTQIVISADHANAESECSICTESFQLGDDDRQMPCHESHILHARCLLQWLEKRDTCPICRTRLVCPVNGRADSESDEFVTSTTSNNG